jgi:AGZA family xanthine/uracil permease-like MFS transporter
LDIVFTFFFVALFDSTGTLIGVLQQGNIHLTPKDSRQINNAFYSDAGATILGSYLGTSTVGSYIESAAGVRAGGRTGLTAAVVGVLFIFALFFAPLAKTVPDYATAPALLFVSGLMIRSLNQTQWRDLTESIPALVIMFGIPLTFSIAQGISFGFIAYVILKTLFGRARELTQVTWILSIFFTLYLFLQF